MQINSKMINIEITLKVMVFKNKKFNKIYFRFFVIFLKEII
jgi:hypothetical protein